jgi:multiple sugar transport system ATP-binding protein
VTVRTANGGTAALPLAQPAPAGAPKSVVLGVRPEHIYRFSEDLKHRKPGIATIEAPVELVEPTGAETLAVLRFGDLEVTGRFDPDSAPRMGERMTLGIDMARACLFDPKTQSLL